MPLRAQPSNGPGSSLSITRAIFAGTAEEIVDLHLLRLYQGPSRVTSVDTSCTMGWVKPRQWECDRTGSRASDMLAERLGTEPLNWSAVISGTGNPSPIYRYMCVASTAHNRMGQVDDVLISEKVYLKNARRK